MGDGQGKWEDWELNPPSRSRAPACKAQFQTRSSRFHVHPMVSFLCFFQNVQQRCLHPQEAKSSWIYDEFWLAWTSHGNPSRLHQWSTRDGNVSNSPPWDIKGSILEDLHVLNQKAVSWREGFFVSPFLPVSVAGMRMCHLEQQLPYYDHEVTSLKTTTNWPEKEE